MQNNFMKKEDITTDVRKSRKQMSSYSQEDRDRLEQKARSKINSEISLSAPLNSELEKAIVRIKCLKNPDTLNALFNEFQSFGVLLGGDNWAEHCVSLLRTFYIQSRKSKNEN